ncbi:MAG: AMP-binding protein, partial [Actinomycetota bacterium]|nr:AMP-binding protein [Actinomycetota bacterium]
MTSFTFSPLTPTSYLDRAGYVFAERPAVVDGEVRLTYAELGERSHRLAGALAGLGVQPWDRVAVLCTNSHVMLEMHHGVPFAGAVLVPMNTRLPVRELADIVEHSGAQVLVTTGELTVVARLVAHAVPGVRLVVAGDTGDGTGDEYEALLAAAEPLTVPCADERDLLAINYTSGTRGHPKGVMYHHRGAALQALAMALHSRLMPGD